MSTTPDESRVRELLAHHVGAARGDWTARRLDGCWRLSAPTQSLGSSSWIVFDDKTIRRVPVAMPDRFVERYKPPAGE